MKRVWYVIMAVVVVAMGLSVGVNAYAQSTQTVRTLIEGLELGEPVSYENLTIIPIYYVGKPAYSGSIATFEEALQHKWLQISEIESGHVPQVRISNLSDKYIYIMGGEVLTGCRQDRIVGRDVLVRPHNKNLVVPVYCVEQGRWSSQSAQFSSKENLGTSKLRGLAQMRQSDSQTAIWGEVAKLSQENKVSSSTSAYQGLYDDTRVRGKIKNYEEKMLAIPQLKDDTVGVIVGIGDRIVSADIFYSPELFKKIWPKLLKSSALAAVTEEGYGAVTPELAADFLRNVHLRGYSRNPAVDAGVELTAIDNELNVNALVFNEAAIHLAAFPQTDISMKPIFDEEQRIPVIRR